MQENNSWREVYERTALSADFRLMFGKSFPMDQFRPYSYGFKFESLTPGLLSAASTTPNTGSLAATVAGIAAPTTNIVPGPASETLIDFPKGAIIVGASSAAVAPQRVVSGAAFTYGPSMNPGGRDLYVMNMRYVDGSAIFAKNPIPEVTINANFPTNTAPPILCDAVMGSGHHNLFPGRELLVAPGLGILLSVQSMILPNAPVASTTPSPNLSVHVVFHCMIPGVVKLNKGN